MKLALPNIFGRFGTSTRIAESVSEQGYDTLKEAIGIYGTTGKQLIPMQEAMPATGGRTSQIEQTTLYAAIMDEYSQVTPQFELELLRVCTHLAKFNGDISYAVDNVVQLGNTPAVISFDSSVPKDQVSKMIAYVGEAEKHIYRGGMNSLQNDLFAQIAINGAISTEMIPNRTIEYIQKVVLVNPFYIRFRYNPDNYDYDAYQAPPNYMGGLNTTGLIKLNPITYRYHALRLFNDNPYAIPPFISALETMEIEKDMLKNMRHIVKKLGLFGFLSVLVQGPVRTQGEKETAYYARVKAHLETLRPELEKGYSTGMSIGIKGAHEFKIEGANTNVAGAKDLFELITQMKSAGIKQDPLMLGRNFNVAETMARVIMAKLTTQVANYQRIVARFRADLYYMMLTLGGFKLKSVQVEYAPPMIGDKLRDEQAFAARLENQINLRDRGIIGQQDVANAMGREKPYAVKDVDYSVITAADKLAAKAKATDPNKTKDSKQATDPTASGSTNYGAEEEGDDIEDGFNEDWGRVLTREELYLNLHRGIPEFVYNVANCGCGHNHPISYAAKDDQRLRTIDDYVALYKVAIGKEYKKAVAKVTKKVGLALGDITEGASVEEVTDKIFTILYTEWGGNFSKAQKRIVERWVTDIYGYFRGDDMAFPSGAKIPDAVFGLHDVRAVQYFRNSDELYLGKFITDSDTRKRITEFIKENYLVGGTPIGRNPEAIAKFQEALGETLMLEDWKIRRIIDTSVNMMRNYGAISYMNQAEVQRFEVLGVNDGLQCGYCRHTNGMTFSLEKAYDKTDAVVKSMPEFVKSEKPFVTGVFSGNSGLEHFQELDEEQIQASGIDVPPFHPFCRCTVVAVLD